MSHHALMPNHSQKHAASDGIDKTLKDDTERSYIVCLPNIYYQGELLQAGMTVQLRCGTVTNKGNVLQCPTYLRLDKIGVRTVSSKDTVRKKSHFISGRLYRRTRDMYGILPRKFGEVAWISDGVEVGIDSVLRKRNLRLTNSIFPAFRVSLADAQDEIGGTLVCRWKVRIKDIAEGLSGAQQLGDCGYIRRLTQAEADEGYSVDDKALFEEWRDPVTWEEDTQEEASDYSQHIHADQGNNVDQEDIDMIDLTDHPSKRQEKHEEAAVNSNITNIENKIIDLTESQVSETSRTIPHRRFRRYKFGDAFCGAGGVTCGAVAAGLKVVFGIDKEEHALKAWARNFGQNRGFQCEIYDFVTQNERLGRKHFVDILHMSPPCQTFSWAKTTQGKNDEVNEASLFAVDALLDYCRPRAVTVEQTDGMIFIKNHQGHFYSLLLQFTNKNFSVKWGVLQAMDYGVPQRRKRLIMVASCPGETLADLPRPTHYYYRENRPNRNWLPYVPTIREALANIPALSEDQEITYLQNPREFPPHEWDEPLQRLIKASAMDYDTHPSGVRRFTVRELACLSTFPPSHKFHGPSGTRRRQVGNAVPVRMAEAILREVALHLEEQDKERAGLGIL